MEIYAVFIKMVERVPGDQRSIDHPGHGYPAHTVDRTEVKEFKNRESFVEWITNQEAERCGKVSYRAFKCTPVKISTKIEIDE